jgi:hypothetical protein
MKRTIAILSLLLILVAVSTGPGIAWAAASAPQNAVESDPPDMYVPEGEDPGGDVECLGDPDDAITGNRNNGATDDLPDLGALSGQPDPGDVDYDEWYALLMMLIYMGLI